MWKFQYVDKLPPGAKSADLEFGTSIHEAIEMSFSDLSALDWFERVWHDAEKLDLIYYKYRHHDYLDMGLRFLDNFERRHKKKYSAIWNEAEFKFAKQFSYEGTMDFYGTHDGKTCVVDFKTSEKAYDKSIIKYNPQLYVYSQAVFEKTGKFPDKIMYLVFIKSEAPRIQTLELEINQKMIDDVFINLNMIQESSCSPVYKNFHACNYCNYKGECYGK